MIVQDYGCWEYVVSPGKSNYHVLLEWGSYNLEDHFATFALPATVDEIIKFWKCLLGIISALGKIHSAEVPLDNQAPCQYYG